MLYWLDEELRWTCLDTAMPTAKSYHCSIQINDCEILFFCTPEGYCLKNVNKYLDQKKLIIDLSPDFRIKDVNLWKKWYKVDHTEPLILKNSV